MKEISKPLLKRALEAYIEKQKADPILPNIAEKMWETRRAEEAIAQLEMSTPMSHEFLAKGGDWLGVVRDFIQRKFRNGESVTWGSHEYLEGHPLTVSELEHLASSIARAAVYEYRGKS